ncbi:hypothetical protein CC1G_00232 [Coprinopsis cinerea okayama7|uniref:DUF7719 domain-containing protein n=1 Tax=Coprinopsis cinerea (strain Okayama-7 / 130 / ATCC MYA-4618 / FGSC 9003) TaxID=240176 RepID=A8NX85_COPC7|nr:hypothetical protein CC1G_00232 [Coprinopsis cinerea okayama7\|eukprot:XP_001837096.1 hypothetical protein CC1G_00232 [Coprinopsis cinerea okayama7\
MTSKRKNAIKADVKLKKPSEIAAGSQPSGRKPLIELSEDEQMRLIKQSGILDKMKTVDSAKATESSVEYVEERLPLAEEIFNATLFIIPTCFLLLLMEILIHFQYQQKPTLRNILDRMIPSVPILSLFVFYTLRYKSYRKMQLIMFFIAILSSTRLIYQFNKSTFMVNMKQGPPLVTLWIYCIVQLDLSPAVISLAITSAFVYWKNLKLVF